VAAAATGGSGRKTWGTGENEGGGRERSCCLPADLLLQLREGQHAQRSRLVLRFGTALPLAATLGRPPASRARSLVFLRGRKSGNEHAYAGYLLFSSPTFEVKPLPFAPSGSVFAPPWDPPLAASAR